jgi:hypothetical protein
MSAGDLLARLERHWIQASRRPAEPNAQPQGRLTMSEAVARDKRGMAVGSATIARFAMALVTHG